jgi:hypothetical protein
MKNALLAATLLALLVLGSRDLRAQAYGPYPYDPYWDAQYQQYLQYAQQYDPYSELHIMHYQLYLPQYTYQLYPPCCYSTGFVIVPQRPARIVRRSRPVMTPRSQTAGSPLPRATAPLPPATPRR